MDTGIVFSRILESSVGKGSNYFCLLRVYSLPPCPPSIGVWRCCVPGCAAGRGEKLAACSLCWAAEVGLGFVFSSGI